ncbi:hypothetical protein Plhal304r1_c015g0056631 [Plasmopara halstedii]
MLVAFNYPFVITIPSLFSRPFAAVVVCVRPVKSALVKFTFAIPVMHLFESNTLLTHSFEYQ